MSSRLGHYIAYFLFPFLLIHIVWPSSSLPSHEQATHQRRIQQILCEMEQLCSTQQCSGCNSQNIQYGLCMYVNVNAMNWIRTKRRREIIFMRRLTLGAFCILYPLFITFSSFPFNLCRQGRHQSEWQVVWSSFRARWEKERCQHKYPSWIHGGHGAAMATMNLHPLSRAEKHEPISVAENHAVTRRRRPLRHKQTKLPVYRLCLIVCSFLFPHRQTDCHVVQWTYIYAQKNG